MSEFKKYISSNLYLNGILQNPKIFNSLKDKFPEILADLTVAKRNVSCPCVKRVISYLISKFDAETDYFNNLFSDETTKKMLITLENFLNSRIK
jgi:hypothetical protein